MGAYYPPVGFHFSVDFGLSNSGQDDGDARFMEVTGLEASMGTEDVNEGGENRYSLKLPTRASYSNLTLKRGMYLGSSALAWIKKAIDEYEFNPSLVTVKLLNDQHQPLATWEFVDAYPVKWSVSDFNATSNDFVVETIELAYTFHRHTNEGTNQNVSREEGTQP